MTTGTTDSPARPGREPSASTLAVVRGEVARPLGGGRAVPADDDDPREKRYILTMYPYPSGDLHIGHWYAATGPDIVARMRACRATTSCSRWASTRSACRPRTRPSTAASTPRRGPPATSSNMRAPDAAPWAACSTGRARWSTCDPDVLPLDAVAVPEAVRGRPGVQGHGAVDWCPKDQVVLAREQVVGRRAALLALRHAGREARPGAVVLPHHQLRRRAARLHGHRLAGADPADADQLDRAQRGRGDRLPGGGRRGRADPRLHHPPRHAVRGHLHGPGAGASAGGGTDHATTGGPMSRPTSPTRGARRRSSACRTEREKTGVFIGAYARNPMTDERIPIWIADYVLPGYGTGAIMAVPAHDERDFAFARRYELPIRYVVAPAGEDVDRDAAFVAHTADEVLLDSGEFTGMQAAEAIRAITAHLEEHGLGTAAVTYRQRDWLVSRQRYWGAPIPIVYCAEHGAAAGARGRAAGAAAGGRGVRARRRVPAAVAPPNPSSGHLPGMRRARAARDGHHGHLRRLVLVFPALLLAARRTTGMGPEDVADWMPVDLYTGGAEHAVMHLLYSRFFVKALRDMGLLAFRRADPRPAQPGPDPGRRPPAHEQVARQRRRTPTS